MKLQQEVIKTKKIKFNPFNLSENKCPTEKEIIP